MRGSRDAYGAPLEPDDDDEAIFKSATLEDERGCVVLTLQQVLEVLACNENRLSNRLFENEL